MKESTQMPFLVKPAQFSTKGTLQWVSKWLERAFSETTASSPQPKMKPSSAPNLTTSLPPSRAHSRKEGKKKEKRNGWAKKVTELGLNLNSEPTRSCHLLHKKLMDTEEHNRKNQQSIKKMHVKLLKTISVTLHDTFSSCLNAQQVIKQYSIMKSVNGNINIRMAIPWAYLRTINPFAFERPGKNNVISSWGLYILNKHYSNITVIYYAINFLISSLFFALNRSFMRFWVPVNELNPLHLIDRNFWLCIVSHIMYWMYYCIHIFPFLKNYRNCI